MAINVKIIADSVSPSGVRLTTFELEYPRFIHSELMTHRLFSRNAASSRAIPVEDMIELVETNPAMPIYWGKAQRGMSAAEETDERVWMTTGQEFGNTREGAWRWARDKAVLVARAFHKSKYHKQVVNRLLEPFTHIKVVVTATEYDNFFWLRNHPAAQPEICKLGEDMYEALKASAAKELHCGEWHVPYYFDGIWAPVLANDNLELIDEHGNTLDVALKISASCCAQVSYRKLNQTVEKALDIYRRLVEDRPVHASPFEHQGSPMMYDSIYYLEGGYDQVDSESYLTRGATMVKVSDGSIWSGNLRGWTQFRQTMDDHTCWDFGAE